jgi:nucleoid-associated protein YejK
MEEEKKKILKLDLSIFENNGKKDFVQIIRNNKDKTVKAFDFFMDGIKNEASDSKETRRILIHYIAKQQLSKEEELHLKKRVYDIFKKLGIGVPFMLIPGATLLIPFILKAAEKKGINLYPTNFNGKLKIEK